MSRSELPPGQQWAARDKWPVVGESSPGEGPEEWSVTVAGAVSREKTWTLTELHAMPQVTLTTDIHCVTRWSKPSMTFEGVLLASLLDQVEPTEEAAFVSMIARSDRGHNTSSRFDYR